jgi:drug/metabolite transporter (DMT)-like permease
MNTQAIILSLFVAFLWALNMVINKHSMNNSINQKTVCVIAGLAYFICILFFALYHNKEIYTDIKNTNTANVIFIAAGAVLGLFIGNVLFMHLLEKNNSSLVTTLAYTSPIFVFLMTFFILKENIEPIKIVGIILTIIGIMILCYK